MGALVTAGSRPARVGEETPAALVEALVDLGADFDELLFLCRSGEAELADAAADLEAASAALHARTRETLVDQLAAARLRYGAVVERLRDLRALAARERAGHSLAQLCAEKSSLADLLRVERALTAALVTAADWQSPSFLHSTAPAAGRQNGLIRPFWNDYKRDRHLDAEGYERRYLTAMVDGPSTLRALLTSCGMAAFTTIVAFLLGERRVDRPILFGQGLYHESRLLLERLLPGRTHAVDESDSSALVHAIGELQPSAVFLDSLSNTKSMPLPELPPVIEALSHTDAYLVVDNTCLSVACQPFALARDSVRVIVFESLLKYAQLGLDRTNAGVIVARREDAELLAGYREHLGTNVADVAVHALPHPERSVLERRLARLQRNAALLADRLDGRCGSFARIVYPGLPSHPCYQVARRLRFRGGCLSILLRRSDLRLRRERALVDEAIAEASARGIALLGGSSFGFDTTRIYLTAARAECGEPFVRIAAGTEHRLEIEELADALALAVSRAAA